MEQDFEQYISMPVIVACFVVLFITPSLLKRWLRNRKNLLAGQLLSGGKHVPTIAERVAGNRAWAKGEILSRGRASVIVLLIAAAAWNLLMGGAFIKNIFNPATPTGPFVVLCIFTAIGIAFAVLAVRMTIRYWRFGQSRCCLTEKAGVVGKSINGVIRTSKETQASGDYSVDIQCLESYSTGTGKNRRTEVKIHWQSKQQVAHGGKNSKLGIPFSFDLPAYLPETGYKLARGNVHWQLKIHAPVKGVDYAATFVVPVFKIEH